MDTHTRLQAQHAAAEQQAERTANRYSLVRLVSFLAGAASATAGVMSHNALEAALGLLLFGVFCVAVVLHSRTITAQTAARIRRDLHARHILRIGSRYAELPHHGTALLPEAHPYSFDIDLLGPGSLFQRLQVTHTLEGSRTLAAWLGRAASAGDITARQTAVRELTPMVEFRAELEAAAGEEQDRLLDGSSVERLTRAPAFLLQRAALRAAVVALPLTTLATYVLGQFGLLPSSVWLLPVVVQIALLMIFGGHARHTLELVSAEASTFNAFEQMLLLVERARFESPLLSSLQRRIALDNVPASGHLRRIARWAGFAELRQNGIFYVFVNTLTLWDLHVLWGVERFVRDVGRRTGDWFTALAELEALCSLATLAYTDPDATFPELCQDGEPLQAEALAHPLLAPSVRVHNDVSLRGPGTALVVTGSNMAGKSTLLRAVGQNIALALAGGPVIARKLRLPSVRLRASMRADDSLQAGSSYFHAELQKLKGVVTGAEEVPPVFFLLDELLRGTNAKARHIGARAVLFHLLERGGTGLCATHDVELAALESEHAERISNVHFTDVMVDGEMRFDYKLRPGIVRTSNALRLLQMAGIAVPEAEREALESADSGEAPLAETRAAVRIVGAAEPEVR